MRMITYYHLNETTLGTILVLIYIFTVFCASLCLAYMPGVVLGDMGIGRSNELLVEES